MTGPWGLLLDYGGVLTGPIAPSFVAFERRIGLPADTIIDLLVAASRTADGGVIGQLERGELDDAGFDALLRGMLAGAGHHVPEGALLAGLFAATRPAGPFWEVARRARTAGFRTGVLSNSWGTGMYPQEELAAVFDVRVLSGEVGLRKPDPAIYHLALDRLDVAPERCAFVDDLPHNVAAARELGLHAILHTGDDAATVASLVEVLGPEVHVEVEVA